MPKIESSIDAKRLKKAIKHTHLLIRALDDLMEHDGFHPYSTRALSWQLSALKRLLEREEDKVAFSHHL